jgi:hypothetical protein
VLTEAATLAASLTTSSAASRKTSSWATSSRPAPASGVRVQVNEDDVDAAEALYHEYMESLRSGPYPVAPVRAWPIVVLATLLVGVPFFIFGRRKY